jgi:hypothetical protein
VIAFRDIVPRKSMKAPGRTTTARLEMERGDDLDSAISTLIANITCCSVDGSKKSIHENILDKGRYKYD